MRWLDSRDWVSHSAAHVLATLHEAVDSAIPMPALTAALFTRFASRQDSSFSAKILAALRKEFGGHEVRPPEQQ